MECLIPFQRQRCLRFLYAVARSSPQGVAEKIFLFPSFFGRAYFFLKPCNGLKPTPQMPLKRNKAHADL